MSACLFSMYQVDVASKKGDHLKKQSLEADLSTVSEVNMLNSLAFKSLCLSTANLSM